ADAGSSDTVDVAFSEAGAAAAGEWEWRPARGGPPLRAQRIPIEEVTTALGQLVARSPFDASARALLRPRGETWRLTLPRPRSGSGCTRQAAGPGNPRPAPAQPRAPWC